MGCPPASLGPLHQLCVFQLNRLKEDARMQFKHIRGSDAYADGEYELGVTSPKGE